jgi:hypothetical protein
MGDVHFGLPLEPLLRFAIGVDLGQSVDPTAVTIIEEVQLPPLINGPAFDRNGREIPPPSGGPPEYHVRYLERLPLGTSYMAVVSHVADLILRPPLTQRNCRIVIDYGGVGRPVYDLFTRGGLRPIGVSITGGEAETRETMDIYHVAKIRLVGQLHALLHSGKLKIARELPEADTLVSELQLFRSNISDSGNMSFNARTGAHDDLILSMAIACWWLTRPVNQVTLREL